MARGRMINSKITRNKLVDDLSDDTSRLAFTWLVTFADVEGRTNGDPALVRSLVFPRRTDVSVERMAAYIREWADAGLVLWYEAEGDSYIAFPTFAQNQRGLDRRKEPPSDIPAPTEYVPGTESVRTEHVPSTAEQKRTEVQQKEEGGAIAPAPALPKTSRPRDERLEHVAIQAIRSVTGRWPQKGIFDRVIREVGTKPDLKKMRECYEVWVSRHNDPLNLDGWLFDWYFHGVRQQGQKGARASPPPAETDEARERRALAENAKTREVWASVNR